MKRRLPVLLLSLSLVANLTAAAIDLPNGRTANVSSWADWEIIDAYRYGLVDPNFDLGPDYTSPITRGQLARLSVDFILAVQENSLPDLAAGLEISTTAPLPGQTPAPLASASPASPVPSATETPKALPSEAEPAPCPSPASTPSPAPSATPTPGDPLDGGLPGVIQGSFTDTQSLYIEVATRLGVVRGYDGLFRPNDPVNRAESAVMMRNCMNILGASEANRQPKRFSDAYTIPSWARESIQFISGRVTGSGRPIMGGAEGQFSPYEPYTIEQAILSVARMFSSLRVNETCPDWKNAPGYSTVDLALTFGGDCTLGRHRESGYSRSFDEMYDQQGPAYFFSGIPHFFDDDLTMVNFEGTLTDSSKYADKTFVFKGPAKYAEILPLGSIDVVTVANNHSHDYLARGFQDTVANLSPHVSVSGYTDLMPIVEVKGVKIGFASNVGWSFDAAQKRFIENAVRSLRDRGAEIIVFNYHWGQERAYQSNSTQQAIARYCIDQGADLVIGHHPHVVQEVETYKGKQIAYSLGNLVFGGNRNPSDKNCLIFRQNFTLDLDARTITAASYQAVPYRVSSVDWRNDYHPVPAKQA